MKVLLTAFFMFVVPLPTHVFSGQSERQMVLVPAGEFFPGAPGNQKPMDLPAFFIDSTEVTQGEYEKITGANPSFFKGKNLPVEKVTWFEARDFCQAIGKRLPTEWEWEKAAKAGSYTLFFWGNKVKDEFAWYKGNSRKSTHPVGSKKSNSWGLFDMSGNVWEWTSSDAGSLGKIKRGGSWRNTARSMRSHHRITSLPHFKYHYVGFRCARDFKPS